MGIRRVNLWAGPGSGKSTTAMHLTACLKKAGSSVEYVPEFIKEWAFLKRVPQSFEQAYLFACQMHWEDVRLTRGIELIVTDSPLLMNLTYSKRYGFEGWPWLLELGRLYEKAFPSLNIFLSREGIAYQQIGRYESPEQADWMDKFMLNCMDEFGVEYTAIPTLNQDRIFEFVKEKIVEYRDHGRDGTGKTETGIPCPSDQGVH